MNSPSRLEEKLFRNEFPVTAELFAVRGARISSIIKKAEKLRPFIDAFNVTDNHRATMRTCPLAICAKLLQSELEPVMQMTCRDRNRLALQSDVLGASVLGIRNVFVVTGDHLSCGDNKMAYPVFDLDSVQLLSYIRKLENGSDASGGKLRGKPSYFKGAAVNLTATPDWIHLAKNRKKIKAGAQFFQSQLIFDPERAISTIAQMEKSAYILAGVTILKSLDMALFLRDKIPGVLVPDDVIRRMERAGDGPAAGLEIAAGLVKQLKPHVNGLHVMAFGLEEKIPLLLKKAGLS